MDLNTIRTIDREVNLVHPETGEELGLVFQIHAPDCDEVKSVTRKWQDKRLLPKNRNKAIRSEELENVTDNRIKAAVFGWKWTDKELTIAGEQPEYSKQELHKMLKENSFIREFLSDECEDLIAFF